jgi:RimJ/RimL family protein N-acetyltransferase
MALWTWWPGDPLPSLATTEPCTVRQVTDPAELAPLTALEDREIQARLATGNRCYVAYVGTAAAAYGWVAVADAAIGELDLHFCLAGTDRYLWDFQTLPAFRGRGLYPRLLQTMLHREGFEAARFWIINAPENLASARGIEKAGFQVVGDLAFAQDGRAGLLPRRSDRGVLGAALLRVPLIEPSASGGVSPCWCCVIGALREGGDAACWPATALHSTPCSCGQAGTTGAA